VPLSRFLAALEQPAVEARRPLSQQDLVARPLQSKERHRGLWDRCGERWYVFDADGKRQAARQRAAKQRQTSHQPIPPMTARLLLLGLRAQTGGEAVVRTRTTISASTSHQLDGDIGNPGKGDYRGDPW